MTPDELERWKFHPGWDDEMKRALRALLDSLRPANDNNEGAPNEENHRQ